MLVKNAKMQKGTECTTSEYFTLNSIAMQIANTVSITAVAMIVARMVLMSFIR